VIAVETVAAEAAVGVTDAIRRGAGAKATPLPEGTTACARRARLAHFPIRQEWDDLLLNRD
jgi:hypothetical protein